MACVRVSELAPRAKDLALHGAQAVVAVGGDLLVGEPEDCRPTIRSWRAVRPAARITAAASMICSRVRIGSRGSAGLRISPSSLSGIATVRQPRTAIESDRFADRDREQPAAHAVWLLELAIQDRHPREHAGVLDVGIRRADHATHARAQRVVISGEHGADVDGAPGCGRVGVCGHGGLLRVVDLRG
jgi:hypothetical protein